MEFVKLGDIFQHNTGKALNKKDVEGTLLPYITTSNLYWDEFKLDDISKMYFKSKELDKCLVTRGDLLVCEGGDVGRSAIWNYDYDICIQNHIHRLRPIRDVNVKFYYYVLYYYKQNNKISGKGVTIAGLSSNALDRLLVPLPGIEEQNKIVAKLDKIEDLISKRKKQLEYFDTLIKARFNEMFGDPLLNERKWGKESLMQVCPIQQYKGNIVHDGKAWLLNLDMVESQTGEIINKVIVGEEKLGGSIIKFSEDNVLYSKLRPYLNKVVIPYCKGYATSEMVPLCPSKIMNRVFVANVLRNPSFLKYINDKCCGAKMPRVSMEILRNYDFIVPPLELQNQFADFVTKVETIKSKVKASLEQLDTLRKAQMQKYFG